MLNRPNVGEKPQYAVMTFLNQLELSRSDSDVELAKRLIDLYFQFFDAATKDGELGSKLLSAVLTGVNRAHPFAGISAEFFQKYVGSQFVFVAPTRPALETRRSRLFYSAGTLGCSSKWCTLGRSTVQSKPSYSCVKCSREALRYLIGTSCILGVCAWF